MFRWIVDHYTDECLIGAGGQTHGTIDIYQMYVLKLRNVFNLISSMKRLSLKAHLQRNTLHNQSYVSKMLKHNLIATTEGLV